jgi:hypothetical protein
VHQLHSPRMQTSRGIRRKLMVPLSTQSMPRNQLEQQQQGTRAVSRWRKQETMSRAQQMQRQMLAAASASLQIQVQAHQLRQGMLQLETPQRECQVAQRGIQGRLRWIK